MEEKTGSFKPVKKKKGAFNAVDALIILLVVGIAAIFIVSRLSFNEAAGEKIKLEYTVAIEGVDKDFVDKISAGERVYDSSSKSLLGTVSSLENETPYSVYEYDTETGEMVKRSYPDRYTVTVTVSAKAQFVEGVGYSVGGCRVAVGQKMSLRFPNYSASAYCIGMRVVK